MKIYIDSVVCKGCGLCIHYCPRHLFELSDRHNEKGYSVVQVRDTDECTACRLCEIGCPDLAIYIHKAAE